ncbi:hypothetical protein CIW49_30315, partial [Mycolicibacterium sp. P1-18]
MALLFGRILVVMRWGSSRRTAAEGSRGERWQVCRAGRGVGGRTGRGRDDRLPVGGVGRYR